jgi:hypothetical protein
MPALSPDPPQIPDSGDTPKASPRPGFGDTPKRRANASKQALQAIRDDHRLFIKKTVKNGLDLFIVRTGEKGRPYFRAQVSKAGYAVHFRYKDPIGKWVEPYACYLSKEEFSQIKGMLFPDLARMIAGKIEQRRPSFQVSQHDLNTLLAAVQSCI